MDINFKLIIAIVVTVVIIAVILLYPVWVYQRRRFWQRRSLPAIWHSVLVKTVPMYSSLSPEQQQQLQGNVQVLLAEKQFIGCRGLQVTLEMKVTIAAIACLLLFSYSSNFFPKLRSILIYPDAYWVQETVGKGYIVEERQVARLGESWQRDQVILSWNQVQYDVTHWQDGRNVVLHEFAHQLDQADGKAEGVPILATAAEYDRWAEVMTAAYQRHCQAVELRQATVLDEYGATNPAEFFAVATETFFELPANLQRDDSSLYRLLRNYYRLDPLRWS
jgi:Mlc titration factor MtfA (ptsG expression regulator)